MVAERVWGVERRTTLPGAIPLRPTYELPPLQTLGGENVLANSGERTGQTEELRTRFLGHTELSVVDLSEAARLASTLLVRSLAEALANSTRGATRLFEGEAALAHYLSAWGAQIGRHFAQGGSLAEMLEHALATALAGEVDVDPIHEALVWIEQATNLPQARLAATLRVSRQTIHNWRRGSAIADENRRHLLAVQDVLRRASARYPTTIQLLAWLDTPRGADSRTPADLLATGEVDRARLLALSTPSPGVRPQAPRTVPGGWKGGAERYQEPLRPDHDDLDIGHFEEDADELVPSEGSAE